jgi:putative aldouronate transport system permease protein
VVIEAPAAGSVPTASLILGKAKRSTGIRRTRGERIFAVVNVVVLCIAVAVTLFPFVNVVAQSMSSEKYIDFGLVSVWPRGWDFETYGLVLKDPTFWISYKNTVLYTVVSTAVSIVLSTMFAYAVSRPELKGRKFFIGMAIVTMLYSGGIIPTYIVVNKLALTNTIWAIALPGAISVFNVLVMKSFFENLPNELLEAAQIDGLNTYGILLRIVLPLSKAVMATMILFYAVGSWNSWFGAFLYMDHSDLYPVTVYLRNLIAGATGAQDAGASADGNLTQIGASIKSVTMVLIVIPILFVYPFIQRYFVSGVMLGSVKG